MILRGPNRPDLCRNECLADILKASARLRPEHPALIWGERIVSYGELDVASGKTVWPTAPNGPMSLSFEAQAPLDLEPDRMVMFTETVLRGAGRTVARLFYEYDPTADGQK